MEALKKGMTKITVEDIFQELHPPVEIALDRALSPQENVEIYFKKYRKGREGLQLLKRRLEITRAEYEEILKMLADLENNFDWAFEKYRSEINSLLPKEGRKEAAAPRLPYKEHQLTTGLTIFIGRDGADNDRTTFEYARPYELWFHAQQCPGSHVVMKYPNKSFAPSKREIEETAAIAAYHSKAKNDSLVPVVYTERRYVHKPRKAKPGLVTVEREKSVMVAPRKPE
jgi:predicted ribosome quality control (RQC) complex YloA/Tae2 family protein